MDQNTDLKLSRDACIDLAKYRADKRFKIFSWSSSLLFGTIAARTFFSFDSISNVERWLLAATVVVLSSFSIAWLRWNSLCLKSAVSLLNEIESRLNVERPDASQEPSSLYEIAVLLLTLLALATTIGQGLVW